MNLKTVKKLLFTGLLAYSSTSLASEKPNFIVILTDDQGYADVGFNGSDDIITPNIDRIANEGTRFTNGYVTYAVCGPSRAGLLTGRYQGRFGFGRNPIIDPSDATSGLPLEEQMISEVLKPVGYTSSIIGKWHMGTHEKFRPNKRGFDHFYGFLSGGHKYFPEDLTIDSIENAKKDWSWYNTKIMENDKRVEIDEYLTDELSNEAVKFIEREQDKPFFLYLAYNAPHTPLQASQEYLDRNTHIKDKKRRTYAAMVTAVDDGVGRILAKLKQLGLDNNTMVFFLSDNGGAKNNASDNGELRNFKGSNFEGGIHVPFAVRWPGKVPAGMDYQKPVSSLDILATFADITKAPIAKERPLDGVNLMPFITGENKGTPHDVLFWRAFDQGTLATRRGDSKVINSDRDGDHLYDLADDLSEQNNLLKAKPKLYQQQLEEVKAWEKGLIDPIFKPLQGRHSENEHVKKPHK
jgi:arylsulfatase A-like enzyme